MGCVRAYLDRAIENSAGWTSETVPKLQRKEEMMRREILLAFMLMLVGLALSACASDNPASVADVAVAEAPGVPVVATPAPPAVVSEIGRTMEGVSTPKVEPTVALPDAPALVIMEGKTEGDTAGTAPAFMQTLDVKREAEQPAIKDKGGDAALHRPPDLPEPGVTRANGRTKHVERGSYTSVYVNATRTEVSKRC